jgi:hypothetical protein
MQPTCSGKRDVTGGVGCRGKGGGAHGTYDERAVQGQHPQRIEKAEEHKSFERHFHEEGDIPAKKGAHILSDCTQI